jgi:hypothetical protein
MFDKRGNIKQEPPHDFLVTAGCWLLDNRRLPCFRWFKFSDENYLRQENTPKLWVITPELHTWGKISDVIGFNIFGVSVCLECKTSRADFLRDKKKQGNPPGNVFYYLTCPGVIKVEKDKKRLSHAGVIEYENGKFNIKKIAHWKKTDGNQEVPVLVRLLSYNNIMGIMDYRKKEANSEKRKQD